MKLTEFDYELPPERIAQRPPEERDASRLLWLHRQSGEVEDRQFRELPELLVPGDLLVANDSRVFPARLLGQRVGGGQGKVEVLLLREVELGVWDVLARPGRKLPLGELVIFEGGLRAEVVGMGSRGERQFRFEVQGEFAAAVERHGHVPLPPYIRREDQVEDRARYQTVYAKAVGSAAAPTAGLHFSERVLEKLAERGIEWATVSLHVGLGTFQAVESEEIEDHPMHSEAYTLGPEAAVSILQARSEGRRVIAVGTTAARVLETAAPQFVAGCGETRLYMYPGKAFQAVDALITNFHAPRTSLLVMISAFAGTEAVRRAYRHALEAHYRFLSYGDCMFIS